MTIYIKNCCNDYGNKYLNMSKYTYSSPYVMESGTITRELNTANANERFTDVSSVLN